MTYSLCLYLQEGLVFLSDTKTRVGMDSLFTRYKIHHFHENPALLIALLSSGELSVLLTFSHRMNPKTYKRKK